LAFYFHTVTYVFSTALQEIHYKMQIPNFKAITYWNRRKSIMPIYFIVMNSNFIFLRLTK